MTGQAQAFDVTSTRVFDAPVERVWQAWSDPELVSQWWGPTGFTSPDPKIDFREGGTSLVTMRAPAEYGIPDLHNTWTYHKIEPHRRIEFVLNFSDAEGRKIDPASVGIPAGVPDGVPHVITFKDLGGDRTEMTVTEYGYTSQEAHDTSLAGLEQVLDKLSALLAAG